MAEIVQFTNNIEQQRSRQAIAIGELALMTVTETFGSGDLTWDDRRPELINLPYHNRIHTLSVQQSSLRTAEALGLPAFDQNLVVLAASAHDIVQLGARGEIERASADWVERHMGMYGFQPEDTIAVRMAIHGTEPLFNVDGKLVGQRVSRMEFPDERSRLIAECVAVGDMADLYSGRGPRRAHRLYQELQGVPLSKDPPMDNFQAFQDMQADLAANFQFANPIGESLFGELRQDVTDYHAFIAESFRDDVISTWDHVIELDGAFARHHRS